MPDLSIRDISFNPIAFELEREAIFDRSQQPVVETDYEIDSSDKDCFGTLYRVWKGSSLLGTFYRRGKSWCADPFYSKGNYLKLSDSLKQSFRSNEAAINYIVRCYES